MDTLNGTKRTEQGTVNGIAGLPMVISTDGELPVAESNIKEIIQNSTIPMTDIMREISGIVRDVEAEVGLHEQITITRKGLQMTRSLTLKKDRPS